MNRRQTRKVEKKKLEILQSAAEAFRRNGYRATTIEDIATKLLMTKGSLYYYFKNKEEILYFCQEYSLDRLWELLKEAQALDAPAAEKLRRLIISHVSLILDELKAAAMHADFQMLSPARLRKIIRKRDRFERGVRQIIQDGIDGRVFAECDPKLVTFAILGAINWTVKWFSPEGPMTAEQIGENFADYFLRGLRAR